MSNEDSSFYRLSPKNSFKSNEPYHDSDQTNLDRSEEPNSVDERNVRLFEAIRDEEANPDLPNNHINLNNAANANNEGNLLENINEIEEPFENNNAIQVQEEQNAYESENEYESTLFQEHIGINLDRYVENFARSRTSSIRNCVEYDSQGRKRLKLKSRKTSAYIRRERKKLKRIRRNTNTLLCSETLPEYDFDVETARAVQNAICQDETPVCGCIPTVVYGYENFSYTREDFARACIHWIQDLEDFVFGREFNERKHSFIRKSFRSSYVQNVLDNKRALADRGIIFGELPRVFIVGMIKFGFKEKNFTYMSNGSKISTRFRYPHCVDSANDETKFKMMERSTLLLNRLLSAKKIYFEFFTYLRIPDVDIRRLFDLLRECFIWGELDVAISFSPFDKSFTFKDWTFKLEEFRNVIFWSNELIRSLLLVNKCKRCERIYLTNNEANDLKLEQTNLVKIANLLSYLKCRDEIRDGIVVTHRDLMASFINELNKKLSERNNLVIIE